MHDAKIEIKDIKRPDAISIGRAMERAGFNSVEDFARYALMKLSDEVIANEHPAIEATTPVKSPAA